jgi:DNA-binding transcriptional MerR regulator/GGDEF domain-containing protein
MDERTLQGIKQHLQNKDAQNRIVKDIQRGRLEATVTIGRAASLFNFTENQLRDWEVRHLLTPLKSQGGQRLYPLSELDKLAIIRELLNAKFTPGDIPDSIDKIWNAICPLDGHTPSVLDRKTEEHLAIDLRVERTDKALFWKYFASQALRLSLMLIREAVPDTIAGLVLPLELNGSLEDALQLSNDAQVLNPHALPYIGKSLVGWLVRSGSIYVFLDNAPAFEFPSDFRLLPFRAMKDDVPTDDFTQEKTLIVLQRKTRLLTLSVDVVSTIRRLLEPLYEDVEDWQSYFGEGIRDTLYPATDFTVSNNSDMLNGLADMVVRLGKKTRDGRNRWRFCCLLLPQEADLQLSLRQRSLVIQAQSKDAPHKIGMTLSPDKYVNSLNLRAFQSGHIVYRPQISKADPTIALLEQEGDIRSAMALSIGGEKGEPIAVLYIVSDEQRSFSLADQRVLRMMGRIIEELLLTYHARQQVTEHLDDLITRPTVIDPLFGDFASEDDFRRDLEGFLTSIKMQMEQRRKQTAHQIPQFPSYSPQSLTEQRPDDVISFMSVDIDNQNLLAVKYGDKLLRVLSRTIGLRLQEMLKSHFTKHTDCKLYHINANKYYLLLNRIPLDQARPKAEVMRQAFEGHISIEQAALPSIQLSDVTVRIGVASFTYAKLEENLAMVLDSDTVMDSVAEVKSKIVRALDVALKRGMDVGGKVVFAWDYAMGAFVRWSPTREK